MRRSGLPALALGTALVFTGCTAVESNVSLDGDGTVSCVDSAESDDLWAGVLITNTGGSTVLRTVDFGSLTNMIVEDAWFMELADGVGLSSSPDPVDIPQWGDWVNIDGAALAGDHTAQIVLHLRTMDPEVDAMLHGVTLSYDGGSASSTVEFGIIAGGVCTQS